VRKIVEKKENAHPKKKRSQPRPKIVDSNKNGDEQKKKELKTGRGKKKETRVEKKRSTVGEDQPHVGYAQIQSNTKIGKLERDNKNKTKERKRTIEKTQK